MTQAKSILIVDDDPDFVASMQAFLEAGGYKTLTAFDGRQGFKVATSSKPDLIVLDVMMSERTEGFKVLRQIRETPAIAHTPVILVSSLYTELPAFEVIPEAGQAAADLFLPKPVEPEILLREVGRLLTEGRQQSSRKR